MESIMTNNPEAFSFRIKWTDEVDYQLLDKMIEYNLEDKKGMTKYWR